MQSENIQSGFTLVEVVVTLAVAGIIIGMAIPSFRELIANSRLTTTTNNLVASISYARSEAIKRAQTVTVVAMGAGWDDGWNVLDQAGATIRTFEAPADTIQIVAVDANANNMTTLRFDGRGLLLNQAGGATISICDDRMGETGRQIQISATGRPNLDRQFGC